MQEGVLLDSFKNAKTPRSDTIILVKNIPYGTTLSALEEIFSPHGDITRLLLPPAGTIAVVEYGSASDAGKAFRAVAYRRLGSSVIYLEKAPMGLFKDELRGVEGNRAKQIKSGVKPIVLAEDPLNPVSGGADTPMADGEVAQASDEPAAAAAATLFIKNLSFATTTDKLVKTFRSIPSFAFARVQLKPDPKHPGQTLSMGYGFVGFKDKEGANSAMKTMQGFVLDGHALAVKYAQRGVEEKDSVDAGKKALAGVGKSGTAKMIVKNLPFEATKKDVRALFGAHGQLKSVRVPKKFNSSSRGFAFLEFISRKEAENAFDTLKHTHLLGRHVVLEWAEDNGAGGDLDVLRERVKTAYGDGKEERPGKKRKLDMDSAIGRGGDEEGGDDFVAV